jgi:phage baseplate assembly protein V
MSDLTQILERLLQPLRQRIYGMVSRVTLTKVDDAHGRQEMQLTGFDQELFPVVEHFQPFGLRAVPPAGCDGIGFAVGGSRNHLVAFGLAPKMTPPAELAEGDVLLYCLDPKNWAVLTADGTLRFHADTTWRAELEGLEAKQFVVMTPGTTVLQVQDDSETSRITITPHMVKIETPNFEHP